MVIRPQGPQTDQLALNHGGRSIRSTQTHGERAIGSFFPKLPDELYATTRMAEGTHGWLAAQGTQFLSSARGIAARALDAAPEIQVVHVPRNYCWAVPSALRQSVEFRLYETPSGTVQLDPDWDRSDHLLILHPHLGIPLDVRGKFRRAKVLWDLSHDPLMEITEVAPEQGRFASLRKTIPLPDGAASAIPWVRTWVSGQAPQGNADMIDAMRRRALEPSAPPPGDYERYLAHEAGIGSSPGAAMSVAATDWLARIDVVALREARADAYAHATAVAGTWSPRRAAPPGERPERARPLGLELEFGSQRARDAARTHLSEQAIFTPVYWMGTHATTTHLGEPPTSEGRRTLVVPTDWRFQSGDASRLALALGFLQDHGMLEEGK